MTRDRFFYILTVLTIIALSLYGYFIYLQGERLDYQRRLAQGSWSSSLACVSYDEGVHALLLNNYKRGAEYFSNVEFLDPTNSIAVFFLAYCYEETGDYKRAAREARKFLILAPDSRLAIVAQRIINDYRSKHKNGEK